MRGIRLKRLSFSPRSASKRLAAACMGHYRQATTTRLRCSRSFPLRTRPCADADRPAHDSVQLAGLTDGAQWPEKGAPAVGFGPAPGYWPVPIRGYWPDLT